MDEFLKWALIVLGVLVVLVLIMKLPNLRARTNEVVSIEALRKIAGDVRKLLQASKQDSNALLGLLHATSGLAILATLNRVDVSRRLGKKLDLNFEALRQDLNNVQREKLREINDYCPDLRLDENVEWL